MLGCNDFCGHYEWTFNHVRRTWGQEGVETLWAAIGVDAQRHYTDAARARGLRGLLDVWTKTGHEESCDWTFTLDEQRNVLRWDMRQCPSKGFLLGKDLNEDEDYCDHCMGWMVPLLKEVGVEVAAHEHNHRGQCWGEMRMSDRAYQPLELPIDIRKDPRWKHGYLDRFQDNIKLPLLHESRGSVDPCEVIGRWFESCENLVVLGQSATEPDELTGGGRSTGLLLSDSAYADPRTSPPIPSGVLIGDGSTNLPAVSKRFHATDPECRPLLLHAYLPRGGDVNFTDYDLPRPVPLLPLLIRSGVHRHRPGATPPSPGLFLVLLAVALEKPVFVAGVDGMESSGPCHDLDCITGMIAAARGRVTVSKGVARLLCANSEAASRSITT